VVIPLRLITLGFADLRAWFSPKTSLRLAEPKKSIERQLDAKEGLAHREIEEPGRASLPRDHGSPTSPQRLLRTPGHNFAKASTTGQPVLGTDGSNPSPSSGESDELVTDDDLKPERGRWTAAIRELRAATRLARL